MAAVVYDRPVACCGHNLNAAAYLALLRCERGDLDAAQDEARAVVEHATDAGWTVSAQVTAAYLTLAWVALDRDDHPEADGWFARIAEVEAVIPEPHIQLAAAALTALRRADAGDPMGALSNLRLASARLAGKAPPALADRLAHVEAELLCGSHVGQAERCCGIAWASHLDIREGRRPLSCRRGPRDGGACAHPFPNDCTNCATVGTPSAAASSPHHDPAPPCPALRALSHPLGMRLPSSPPAFRE